MARPMSSDAQTRLHNMLGDGPTPPVQVRQITSAGIELMDGLVLPSSCIFLDGKVFLWNLQNPQPAALTKDKFELFEAVVPKPEILLLGTGKQVSLPPPAIRSYLNGIGIQLDVMDTWNACTTYNLLAEEGRRVAAALITTTGKNWQV